MKKNVVLNGNIVEVKPCINRESKSLELTIYLYSCYDEHGAPRSCNTTVYLSELKDVDTTFPLFSQNPINKKNKLITQFIPWNFPISSLSDEPIYVLEQKGY